MFEPGFFGPMRVQNGTNLSRLSVLLVILMGNLPPVDSTQVTYPRPLLSAIHTRLHRPPKSPQTEQTVDDFVRL